LTRKVFPAPPPPWKHALEAASNIECFKDPFLASGRRCARWLLRRQQLCLGARCIAVASVG
jgi:hypothetical protein